MAIEVITFAEPIKIHKESSSKVIGAIEKGRFDGQYRRERLMVGLHDVTPPSMKDGPIKYEILALPNGIGILMRLGRSNPGLEMSSEAIHLIAEDQTLYFNNDLGSQEEIHEVIVFREGQSPRKTQ